MKYILAVLLFAFSIFVIIFGEIMQIGFLFSLLLLLGLIALFSHYAYEARKVTKERDELRDAIHFAEQKTQFISNLGKEKTQLDNLLNNLRKISSFSSNIFYVISFSNFL